MASECVEWIKEWIVVAGITEMEIYRTGIDYVCMETDPSFSFEREKVLRRLILKSRSGEIWFEISETSRLGKEGVKMGAKG